MNIYIIENVVPFPSSEYGGVYILAATDDDDAFDVFKDIAAGEGGWAWAEATDKAIKDAIKEAIVIRAAEGVERGFIYDFIT